MLLIDNHQTEILEFNLFLNQFVRAYDDVYLPLARPSRAWVCSLAERKRESSAIFYRPLIAAIKPKRSEKF